MTTQPDIRAALDRISGLIAEFRRSAEAGLAIDLTGLDQSVATACDAIAALAARERPPLRDSLVALLDDMNGLVAALETQHRAISDSLGGVSSRHRAVAAYGRGAASGKPGRGPQTK